MSDASDRLTAREVLDRIAFLAGARCACGGHVTVYPRGQPPSATIEHTPDCPLSEVEKNTE